MELPGLDHFLGPAAMPVIAISLAFRRAAACAVHAADLPPSHVLIWQCTAGQRGHHRFRVSDANALRTSDCEIPNCRAILDGVTPALKAARTAFNFPCVKATAVTAWT